jgi:hypothetical protein
MPGAFNGSGWDRCGYSESKVLFDEKGGLFHVFASGATGVQCALSSNTCDAAWHCSTCKRGANNPTDCLTCPPGFTLADECSDCTGSCVANATANATANGALLPGQANALTNTSTSVCEAKDRAAREEAAAQGARLLPGRGAKGGRGRRRADRLDKIRAAGYGGGFYEHLGYAVSTDGIHFTQSEHNPVAAPGASTPFTAAMAEAHVFLEDPLVYVYHTSECACPSSVPVPSSAECALPIECACLLSRVVQGTARPRWSLLALCALPCLALPCLALPCLALPCLALPCLALPCRCSPTARPPPPPAVETLDQPLARDRALCLSSVVVHAAAAAAACLCAPPASGFSLSRPALPRRRPSPFALRPPPSALRPPPSALRPPPFTPPSGLQMPFGYDTNARCGFPTVRWSNPDYNGEDLGVEVFSPSATWSLDRFPVVVGKFGGGGQGVSLATKATTDCAYGGSKTQEYCPPVKVSITAQGVDEAQVAQLGLALECVCPKGGTVAAKFLVWGSADGMATFKGEPSATASVGGQCTAGKPAAFKVAHIGLPNTLAGPSTWAQIKVRNDGAGGLEAVKVFASLTSPVRAK